MRINLFSRLASYSQNPKKLSIENFTTEVIAHLIDCDKAFRRAFLRLVIKDKRVLRCFRNAKTATQQAYAHGIIDLVLFGNRRKLLVEIKINADETHTKIRGKGIVPQVRKYLSYRDGLVAYLTTRRSPPPDVNSKRFIGQVFFEDLHGLLKRACLKPMGRMFLEFLEENGMESVEPFSEADARRAAHSFRFASKCESTIDEITQEITRPFRRLFQVRAGFTSCHFSTRHGSAYSYTRYSKWRGAGRAYINVYIQPHARNLGYGVSINANRGDLQALKHKLSWDEERKDLYTWHLISRKTNAKKMALVIMRDLKDLRHGLSKVFP